MKFLFAFVLAIWLASYGQSVAVPNFAPKEPESKFAAGIQDSAPSPHVLGGLPNVQSTGGPGGCHSSCLNRCGCAKVSPPISLPPVPVCLRSAIIAMINDWSFVSCRGDHSLTWFLIPTFRTVSLPQIWRLVLLGYYALLLQPLSMELMA